MNVIDEYKNVYVKHMVDFIMNSNMNMDEKIAALDMLHAIDKQCVNKRCVNKQCVDKSVDFDTVI